MHMPNGTDIGRDGGYTIVGLGPILKILRGARNLKLRHWKKVNFLGGYPWGGGGGGWLCDIFLTELNPGYEVGEYELSRCVG